MTQSPTILFFQFCLGVIDWFCIGPNEVSQNYFKNNICGVKTALIGCKWPWVQLALSWLLQQEHSILVNQESRLDIVLGPQCLCGRTRLSLHKSGSFFVSNFVSSYFWILAHSAVHSCCSSEMILCDVSSSLRVHRSSAASGERYPFTTSLPEEVNNNRERAVSV